MNPCIYPNLGSVCVTSKNTTIEGKGGQAPKTEEELQSERIKKRYYEKREKNEKLSFLSNPITRPCGFVEYDDKPHKSDEEPAMSLATASRIANITKDNEDDRESFAKMEVAKQEAEEKANKSNAKIEVDFKNLDDSVVEQGQTKHDLSYEKSYENRSSNNFSKDMDGKDSLTFKPEGFLKAAHPDPQCTPMSFGGNILNSSNK